MKVMLIVAFGMNLVMSGAMQYMIAMIRSLQMILHIPILNVLIPGNVSMLFSIMVPIVMFDILDSSYTSELVLTFDEEAQD